MAFDKGLYNIIHLIDIFNENTNDRIIRFLGKKYLDRNLKNCQNKVNNGDSSFKQLLENEFEAAFQHEIVTDDISEKLDATDEMEMMMELDDIKPSSSYGYKSVYFINNCF